MQTFTGIDYLKIDIASNFGLDKEDWDTRIAWVDAHEADLEKKLQEAEEPALYYAGVQAYRKTQKGKPTGYPVSLDAASSGLQILACLTGCEDSARLCGVVSTGHREDAYTVIYQAMCQQISDTAKIERKDTKKAIMTSLYSSTAEPKRIFGEGALLDVFYETMETMAPGAWQLNQALKDLWQPKALSHDWVLPDNFHVHVKVTDNVTKFVQFLNRPIQVTIKVNQGTEEGRSLGPNVVHSIDGMIVREIHRRCSYDPVMLARLIEALLKGPRGKACSLTRERDRMVKLLWKRYQDSGFLSARILELLDQDNLHLVDANAIMNLIKSLPETPFEVISIHDCFRVHPNYGNDLRQQYNNLLAEIAGSRLLEYLISQIAGHHIPVTKMGDLSSKIRVADYTLC